MGPRSFAARGLTNFLLEHGDLEDQCFELTRGTSVSLWEHLADTPYRIVHELQFSPYDAALLWVAALVIARRQNKERERDKKRLKLVSSAHDRASWLSNAANNVVPVGLVRAASCLATLLVASSLLGDDPTEELIYRPQLLGRDLLGKYLFASSLWSVLVSVLLVAASAAWRVLDPRTTMASPATNITKRKKITTWRDVLAKARSNARIAALPTSVVAILYLAYVHLPLFRHALHGEIDLGLPHALSLALTQALSSFVAFCLFAKLLPKPELSVASEAVGTRETKKYVTDPKAVKRMGVLAKEAKERLQALKSGKRVLRRTYSEGNFGNFKPASPRQHSPLTSAPLTPPRRRKQSQLAPLPEHKEEDKGDKPAAKRSPLTRRASERSPPRRRQSQLASLPEHNEESEGDGPPPQRPLPEEGKSPLARSTSERLPARRHSMLATLPEHKEESKEGGPPSPQWVKYSTIGRATYPSYSPDSPLMDIHLAGPTLSSVDLLAKLKSSKSISVKTSISIKRSSPERKSSVSRQADEAALAKYSSLGGATSPKSPLVDVRLASISVKRTLSVPIRLEGNDTLAKYSSLGGVGIQRSLSVPFLADEDMSY